MLTLLFIYLAAITVITHYGNSLASGHYVCDIRDSDTDNWLHIDDGAIYSVDSRSVMKRPAYLLFYIQEGKRG